MQKISQLDEEETSKSNLEVETEDQIDPQNAKFPYCIVWTTLPLISCLLPFIGHTGICTSDGTIHDFAGAYYVSVDDFAFGRTLKYVPLKHTNISKKKWNDAIIQADKKYEKTMHNICCNNCHSHVAQALCNLNYGNKQSWNMIHIWWMCIWNSKYVDCSTFVQTYYLTGVLLLMILLPMLL